MWHTREKQRRDHPDECSRALHRLGRDRRRWEDHATDPFVRSAELTRHRARRPDLTFLLDAPVAHALARAAARNAGAVSDRFERERSEFFERVRDVYRARAAADPARFAIVDATQPIEVVGANMLAALEARSWIS